MQTHTVSRFGPQLHAINRRVVPPIAYNYRQTAYFARDIYRQGVGTISGKVTEQAIPLDVAVVRRVRLCIKETGQIIREQWSNTSGEYSFKNIDETIKYYVIAFDHTNTYNAVIRDNIAPEVV